MKPMDGKKFCVTFAGAVGSSKTPIAHYLSCAFCLPILSNDAIRTEVKEDLGRLEEGEYEKRRNTRLANLVASGTSFIYDASVDRGWAKLKEKIEEAGYAWFIVSMDLSKELLARLQSTKQYDDALTYLERSIADHEAFLERHGVDVALHISDATFGDRTELSGKALRQWLI